LLRVHRNPRTGKANTIMPLSLIGVSLPTFPWILPIYLFGVNLRWLPTFAGEGGSGQIISMIRLKS
jgi:ABC-type dipeptide/oligopeptide/nickel transport system permease component